MARTSEELAAYYAALPEVYGWDARCKMQLPKELNHKVAIDVACRRGKGVYKLSDYVGANGKAIGIDWRPAFLEQARAGEEKALLKRGLKQSNMTFAECYPERLLDTVGEECADFIYVNCILNLFCDPVEALGQIRRALKPGGLLVCDTVLATGPRSVGVVEKARSLGNAAQAAPHRKDLMNWLAIAGFDITSIGTEADEHVDPAWNADGEATVPVAPHDESISFVATSVRIYAPDGIDRHARKVLKAISEFR